MTPTYKAIMIDDVPQNEIISEGKLHRFEIRKITTNAQLNDLLASAEIDLDLAFVDYDLRGESSALSGHENGITITKRLTTSFKELSVVGISKYLTSGRVKIQDKDDEIRRWIQAGASFWLNSDRLATPNGWADYAPCLKALAERTRERRCLMFPWKVSKRPIMPTELLDKAVRAAKYGANVLIRGESGTGKEFLARHISEASGHSPHITVNCAAVPPSLFDSEFFGHKKGAFTGADRNRVGFFEQAHGGTLFLDEVGDLNLDSQAKLLRALEEGQVRPVGSGEYVPAKPHNLIAATNRRLEEMVAEDKFRGDLLHRLSVIPLVVPSLRERMDDIPPLLDELLQHANATFGRSVTFADREETLKWFENYFQKQPEGTSGNVREMRVLIQRIVCMSSSDVVASDQLASLALVSQTAHIPPSRRTLPTLESKDAFIKAVSRVINDEDLIEKLRDPTNSIIKDKKALFAHAIRKVTSLHNLTPGVAIEEKACEKRLVRSGQKDLLDEINNANPRGSSKHSSKKT